MGTDKTALGSCISYRVKAVTSDQGRRARVVQKKAKAKGETPCLRLLRRRDARKRYHGCTDNGTEPRSIWGAPEYGSGPCAMRRSAAIESNKEMRRGRVAQNDVRERRRGQLYSGGERRSDNQVQEQGTALWANSHPP